MNVAAVVVLAFAIVAVTAMPGEPDQMQRRGGKGGESAPQQGWGPPPMAWGPPPMAWGPPPMMQGWGAPPPPPPPRPIVIPIAVQTYSRPSYGGSSYGGAPSYGGSSYGGAPSYGSGGY